MERFSETEYVIRKKIFSFPGSKFHIYDPQEKLVAFSYMKAFKLKEDIRIFTGEDRQQELFRIKARNIIDISATYDVINSATEETLGAWRRRGIKSVLRDEWRLIDSSEADSGVLKEDSMTLALVRRLLCNLIPQHYDLTINGEKAAEFTQNFNPFVMKIKLKVFRPDLVDARTLLAGALLLCAIEGKQQ